MNRQEALKAVAKYGSGNKAAAALGVSRSTFQLALKRDGKTATIVAAKTAGKSLAAFRAAYDKATIVPAKVKIGLGLLGSQGWEYEVAFAKMCGVSLSDLGIFRDHFADYIVILRDHRRAWAGSKKTAQTMKEML
jgi:hypothetical protein